MVAEGNFWWMRILFVAEVAAILSAIRDQKEQTENQDRSLSIFELILKYKTNDPPQTKIREKLDDEDMNTDEEEEEEEEEEEGDEEEESVMESSPTEDVVSRCR